MNWEQKLQALGSIGSAISLCMRKPGDWYVNHSGVEVKVSHNDSVLDGRYGNGRSPEAAVEDHWKQLTVGIAYVVLNAMSRERRRHVKWNGFMWADVL